MHTTFRIATQGAGLYEFTADVTRWVASAQADEAALTLFIRHTSASLLIQENADAEVRSDLLAWLGRLVPPSNDPGMAYLRHTYEGPDDMPGHIKAAILPVSITIPIIDGRMAFGNWQGIYLFEHRAHPHSREVVALLQ